MGDGDLPDRLNTEVRKIRNAETAEAAHDFRNILGIISMLSELVQMDLPVSSRANQMLSNIRAACADANDLCDRMMDDYSDASKPAERVNLSTLIMAMSPLLATSVSSESALRFELAEDIPLVAACAGAIRQVLTNLVKNATEAMVGGPGTITISTGLFQLEGVQGDPSGPGEQSEVESYCHLSVSDTGCGMEETTKLNLFRRGVTTKEGGHGLGMASIRRIVDRYDGLIQIRTEVGRGTTIRVLFPCA